MVIKTAQASRSVAKADKPARRAPQAPKSKPAKAAAAPKVPAAAPEARKGRKPSGKIPMTIRLDPDLLDKLRDGPGWQQRTNDLLRKATGLG